MLALWWRVWFARQYRGQSRVVHDPITTRFSRVGSTRDGVCGNTWPRAKLCPGKGGNGERAADASDNAARDNGKTYHDKAEFVTRKWGQCDEGRARAGRCAEQHLRAGPRSRLNILVLQKTDIDMADRLETMRGSMADMHAKAQGQHSRTGRTR